MYVGTTARWVLAKFENIEAEPTTAPSTVTSMPVITFAVVDQTDPATISVDGPSLGALNVTLIGSGPTVWLRIANNGIDKILLLEKSQLLNISARVRGHKGAASRLILDEWQRGSGLF
jgi:hypothetical protein